MLKDRVIKPRDAIRKQQSIICSEYTFTEGQYTMSFGH